MEYLLQKVYDKMNASFSSNEFSRIAKIEGLSQRDINRGVIADFLHKKKVKQISKRLWIKSSVK